MDFGDKIRALAKGLRLCDLAVMADVFFTCLSNIESDKLDERPGVFRGLAQLDNESLDAFVAAVGRTGGSSGEKLSSEAPLEFAAAKSCPEASE